MSAPCGTDLLLALGVEAPDLAGDVTIEYHGANVLVRWTSAKVVRVETLAAALASTERHTPGGEL